MDGLELPLAAPLAPDFGDMAPKKPGRPPADAAKRALNDERYAAIQAIVQDLPQEAREFRFAVFRAKRWSDVKRDFQPIARLLHSEYQDKELKEIPAFYAYLEGKYGPGRYLVEVHDAHNHRVDKIPHWIVSNGDDMYDDGPDEDDEDDDYDDRRRGGRPGFRRPRRSRAPDDVDDERANVSDVLLTANRISHANATSQTAGARDMISMVMLTQQSQAAERAAEERRRDENAREDRKREETRAEERAKDAREERRRQDEREERIRKEERDQEAQERREEAERRREDQERRNQEHLRMVEASNKRTEMVLGALATVAPILAKVFEAKPPPPPPESPMMGIMLKSLVDKTDRKDSAEMLMQQMMQMSRMSSEMQAEQMKNMLSTQNTFSNDMLRRSMAMMAETPQGQSEQGQDFLGKLAAIVGPAFEMAKGFFPAKPAAAPAPQPMQQRRMHAPQRPALPAPQPIQAQVPPQQQPPPGTTTGQAPAQASTETPTQPAATEAPADAAPQQEPMIMVLGALRAIHMRLFRNQGELQNLIQLIVQTMPIDLRVAVIKGDEMTVMTMALPWIQQSQVFVDWFDFQGSGAGDTAIPATLGWIRTFVPELAPSLVSVHGPLEQQEAQLADALRAHGLVPKAEANAVPVEVVPQESAIEQAQAPEPAPAEAPPEPGPLQSGPLEPAPLPPTDAVPVPPAPPEAPPSHLSDHDAP